MGLKPSRFLERFCREHRNGMPKAFSEPQKLTVTLHMEKNVFTEQPKGTLAVVTRVTALPGHENALAEISDRLASAVRCDEPGALLFIAHRGADLPSTVLFYEIFRDAAAFDAHRNAKHTLQWIRETETITKPREVLFLKSISE